MSDESARARGGGVEASSAARRRPARPACVLGHAPADDRSAVDVLNRGEIDPALQRAQQGDVGDPQHVRRGGPEATRDQRRRPAAPGHADRGATALAPRQPGDAGLHISRLTRLPDAVRDARLRVDPPPAVDATEPVICLMLEQPRIG